MAAVLALQSCCCHNAELINQDSLSFSASISVQKFSNYGKPRCNLPRTDQGSRFQVQMQQTESSSKLGVNGRPVKMVPASELVKRKTPVEKVNGLTNEVKKVNGSVVNGASLVRSNPPSAIVKKPKSRASKELPTMEGLKVLPSDEGFSWANENYNSWQRNIDIWSFVISFRTRVLFDNAKWAYVRGFTEEKQVCLGDIYLHYPLLKLTSTQDFNILFCLSTPDVLVS